jgi:hypothetical protein
MAAIILHSVSKCSEGRKIPRRLDLLTYVFFPPKGDTDMQPKLVTSADKMQFLSRERERERERDKKETSFLEPSYSKPLKQIPVLV